MPSCVLAYSGGLDTSVILGWLLDEGYDIHAVYVDLGQPCEDREAILQKLCLALSFSCPSSSDDNPEPEGLFRALEYTPIYPTNAIECNEVVKCVFMALHGGTKTIFDTTSISMQLQTRVIVVRSRDIIAT